MTKYSARLGIAALILMMPASVSAADECREKFILCVEQTGVPLECNSVYLGCTKEVTVEDEPEGIDVSIKFQNIDGQVYAALRISSLVAKPVLLGPISRRVTCADGSSEQAIFPIEYELQPSESINSTKILVCQGLSSASAAGADQADDSGGQNSLILICASDPGKTVEIERVAQDVIKYSTSDGVSGSYNLKGRSSADIEKQVCSSVTDNNQTFYNTLKGWLRSFQDSEVIPDDNSGMTTIGVRG